MINYWIVYAGLVLIAIIGCSYRFELKSFLLELFGIYRPIMYFCWYVPFYAISILLLTLIEQICRKNTFLWAFFGIVIPYIGGIILAKFVNIKLVSRIFLDVSTYFPFMSIGYIVAKIDAFGYVNKIIKNLDDRLKMGLSFFIGLTSFVSQYVIRDGFLRTVARGGIINPLVCFNTSICFLHGDNN